MLAGIGGIDLVLLVVAADESVMPQTIEHFQICKLLEIPRGVIAITKKHLVEEELLSLVEAEIRELVEGSPLENAPIVAMDSVSGEGVELLKETLLEEIGKSQQDITAARRSHQSFRLPVDRIFTIKGFGTVVTGTPYAGVLKKGDAVTVYPTLKTGKVRGIEIFNQEDDLAMAGQRTALNLSGLETEDLNRGMVISESNALASSSMFDAIVHLLPTAPKGLKDRSAIRFHHGSAELIGRIHPLENDQLLPGESMLVQFRVQSPTVCCPKDHFILRRYSPMTTIRWGGDTGRYPQKTPAKGLARHPPRVEKAVVDAHRARSGSGQCLRRILRQTAPFLGCQLVRPGSPHGFSENLPAGSLEGTGVHSFDLPAAAAGRLSTGSRGIQDKHIPVPC